jgi:hypothetical protein
MRIWGLFNEKQAVHSNARPVLSPKSAYKPHSVRRISAVAIISLGRAFPHGSCGLPGSVVTEDSDSGDEQPPAS